MAWIESHQALGHHPKTLRLAQELGCNVPCAIGYLHFLWWWALDYAPDGRMGVAEKQVVARACMWTRKVERFWAALLIAGFVDQADGPEVLRIHDWMEYGGKLKEQRALRKEANREAQSRHRHRLRKHDVSADVSAESLLTSAQSKQPTVQNTTEQLNAAAAAVNSPPPARARGEPGFQPMSTLVDQHRRRQRRQDEHLPPEVRERLARPPIVMPNETGGAHG